MKKILIVDDEAENLKLISEMLTPHFQPLQASNGREGIQMAVKEQPALMLLDLNMPDMDGFEVVKKLREQTATRGLPVIMLTSEAGLDSRVKGLDLGADDYMAKPFQIRELLARINARLRRGELNRKLEETVEVANLKIDPKSFQIWLDGEEVKLTQIEFDLLRYFIEHPNVVVDRNRLLSDLWPDAVVTNRTVDTHMANLRKKIKGFKYPLETIYGAGYILKIEDSSSGPRK